MNFKLLLAISKTHITTRAKQSLIAGLGVTFGIATFIILVSFMTGLNGLLDGLILDRTPHIHIYNDIEPSANQPLDLNEKYNDRFKIVRSIKPKLSQKRIHNALPIIDIIKSKPEVLGVTAQVTAQSFYSAGSIDLNGIISGVNMLEESRLYNIDNYLVEGDILDLHHNDNAIIVGAGVAQNLSASIGDRVQIISAQGNQLSLKIVGIYQSGLAEIDNVQSYVNLTTAQRLLGENNSYITDINVKLKDITQALPMSEDIAKMYKVKAVDIGTANAQFDTGTTIRNIITYAVSITLLIVAGFGIYNILNMFIYEKMNDIAILKATGFSGGDVRFIFISQALLIGIVGGISGLIIGYIVSNLINNIPFETDALPTVKTYPINFDYTFYVIGIVFAIVSTFFAGFLPAQKARDVDPVTILRGR